jgi:succinate dehydrogenase / fumarate reductase iron-sulfur subunit
MLRWHLSKLEQTRCGQRGHEVKITLRVQRFNPGTDARPYLQEYAVEVAPTDRVLDALMYVKDELDGTLAFRKSCAHGVCGSDSMIINGQERLSCKTLIQDVADGDGAVVTVEPLKHLPLLRDLIVDQDEFVARWRSVKPYLINEERVEEKERIQSPEERAAFDDPTRCILCASCYSACPVLDEQNPRFIGPAAIAQAARFVLDSRDRGFEDRLEVLDQPDGVWACENHFQCTRACPRGIKVTRTINLTKRKIDGERRH